MSPKTEAAFSNPNAFCGITVLLCRHKKQCRLELSQSQTFYMAIASSSCQHFHSKTSTQVTDSKSAGTRVSTSFSISDVSSTESVYNNGNKKKLTTLLLPLLLRIRQLFPKCISSLASLLLAQLLPRRLLV